MTFSRTDISLGHFGAPPPPGRPFSGDCTHVSGLRAISPHSAAVPHGQGSLTDANLYDEDGVPT